MVSMHPTGIRIASYFMEYGSGSSGVLENKNGGYNKIIGRQDDIR